MTIWKPITESDMLRAWGVAELRSQKAQKAVDQGLVSPPVAAALRSANLDTISADGWDEIEQAVLSKRAPLVGNLLALDVAWYDGAMTVDELRGLKIIELQAWTEKYPTRMLTELCGARHVEGTAPEFKGLGTEVERPVTVAASWEGAPCLVEGYTRVCTYMRDEASGFPKDLPLPMILGISSRIHEWAHPQGHLWFGHGR